MTRKVDGDMASTRTMRRDDRRTAGAISLATVVALIAAALFLSAGTAVASTTCAFDPNTHALTVQIVGDGHSEIRRGGLGHVLVDGAVCTPDGIAAATTTNVDMVRVVGGTGEQSVAIDLGGGPFGPGLTDEPGDSDEIEFDVRFGEGPEDHVMVVGGATGQHVRMGSTERLSKANLNATEPTGEDADVTIRGVEVLSYYGGDGGSEVSGMGGKGTGAPVSIPLDLNAGAGPDLLTGGPHADSLTAGDGSDVIRGRGGIDMLFGLDGAPDDKLVGGGGEDGCQSDPGDVEKTCELDYLP